MLKTGHLIALLLLPSLKGYVLLTFPALLRQRVSATYLNYMQNII